MSFKLSKAVDASKVFITSSASLESRWDPNYYRGMSAFRKFSKGCAYPIEKLKRSLELAQYGISERATEEAVGVPMLRMINLQDDTWDLSDLKYIQMSDEEKKPYLLKQGDILFNRTNSKELVGKCVVFNLPDEYVFASYLIRVRLKQGTLLPDYLTAFLSSRLGRIQIDAISRQIAGMTNINAEEIRGMLVPALDEVTQKKVVDVWQAAIRERDQTIEEARTMLSNMDDVLLEELGIPNVTAAPATLEDRIFIRDFSSVSGKRIDPAANWKSLDFGAGKFPLRKLRDLVSINPVTRFPKMEPDTLVSFVPMDAVSEVFGEILDPQKRPVAEAGSYTPFRENDVIWAKITPCMENGKSALAQNLVEGTGYGSTEFHVFRTKTDDLQPGFLHHLLRLKFVRQHAKLNFTGSSGHQRVDEDFFYRMKIPLPSRKLQERITKKAEDAKARARRLFSEAQSSLEDAKRDIESLILGKP